MQVIVDHGYWKMAAGKFAHYFDTAVKAFKALTTERYDVGEAKKQEIGEGTLTPRKAGHLVTRYHVFVTPHSTKVVRG